MASLCGNHYLDYMEAWFDINSTQFTGIALTTLGCYVALIILVRLNGLRSFAKISGHDFAVTIAIGSVFAATVVSKTPSLMQGASAIALLLIWRTAFSYIRLKGLSAFIENQPLMVMHDGQINETALSKANFTQADLFAKLREANVLNLSQVRAVIIESTGDVSVLHGDKNTFDERMLKNVQRNAKAL